MRWPKLSRYLTNASVTLASVLLCLLLLPARLPGMELLGVAPNWLLIWVVAWSVKRNLWQAALAGWTLGLLQDGMSEQIPSRALSLLVVGVLTALLKKQKYVQEDFISVALIVFAMSAIAETVVALQFSWYSWRGIAPFTFERLSEVWAYYQDVTLASALLSSMWAPALYYPLNYWWRQMYLLEMNSAS
ncbi:MAG: rod shape-determining protein MreD [Geitlerinemataceae cyanobacterium]